MWTLTSVSKTADFLRQVSNRLQQIKPWFLLKWISESINSGSLYLNPIPKSDKRREQIRQPVIQALAAAFYSVITDSLTALHQHMPIEQ